MERYIFNGNILGYTKSTVSEFDVDNSKENLIIVIIDNTLSDSTDNYYLLIDKALRNRNRVVLIGVDDENSLFRPLASLMVTYRAYDIYQVSDKEMLSSQYLQTIEEREPDLTEVESFIGGDVTAYSDLSTILFGIESLVDEGNEEKLKSFLDTHMISIENLTTTLNYMKKTCDIFNSRELLDKINSVVSDKNKLEKTIEKKDKEIKDIKLERDRFKVAAEDNEREVNKLNAIASDLKLQAETSNGVTIKSYKEINTSFINCKTKMVMYFKEVSYVPYTNSLIIQLFQRLEMLKLKVKLVIYDTQTNMHMVYNPLNTVSGKDYLSMKSTLINKTKQFVVTEPNQSILQDILTSEQCFDVVIVYDRMKSPDDLVVGNLVSKFFILNSSKEYDELHKVLKITDPSFVITNFHSRVGATKGNGNKASSNKSQYLDIPYIDGYSNGTESSKTNKYMRLVTRNTGVLLLDTIIKKSRVDTLYT